VRVDKVMGFFTVHCETTSGLRDIMEPQAV
jgi:hypothetical protein